MALTTKKVAKVIKFDNAKEVEGAKNELKRCHATKERKDNNIIYFQRCYQSTYIRNLYIIQLFGQ
jgi:hypothetical protein